jgi:hypothetical protein
MEHRALTLLCLLGVATLVVLGGRPVWAQSSENMLANPDFERGFRQHGPFETAIVAEGWTPWWIPQSMGAPAWKNRMPEYKAAAPYGYRVHAGRNAQQLFSFHGTHIGGIYQVVEGIEPGSTLRFTIWGHAWAGSSDNPHESVGGGPMRMAIGIDPTGGTSARSSRVIWSREQNPLEEWVLFEVEAVAIGSSVTVFTRSAPQYPTKHNDVYWDQASLVVTAHAPTPTATADKQARQVIVYKSPADTPTSVPTPRDMTDGRATVASPNPTASPTLSPTSTPTVARTPVPTPARSAICVMAYKDRNGNRACDEEGELLAGATFTLTVADQAGAIQVGVTTADEPFCFEGLDLGLYWVALKSPPGYRSSANEWMVKLVDGPATIQVEHRQVDTRAQLAYPSSAATATTQGTPESSKLLWGGIAIPVVMVAVLIAGAIKNRM